MNSSGFDLVTELTTNYRCKDPEFLTFLSEFRLKMKTDEPFTLVKKTIEQLSHRTISIDKLKELYTANKEKLARLPNAEYWNFGDHLDKISPLKSKSHSVDDEDALRFVLNNDPNRYTGGADIPAELAIELDMLEETLSKE